MGYHGVFLGLHWHNDKAVTNALDTDTYDLSSTITIRVPVSIPYMPDQAEFERVDGQFEYKGELYRLIKQRYAEDTLTVVCVVDTGHRKIDMALADYIRALSDNAADTKPVSKTTVSFIKDYLLVLFEIDSQTNGWALGVALNPHQLRLVPSYSPSIVHPPERA